MTTGEQSVPTPLQGGRFRRTALRFLLVMPIAVLLGATVAHLYLYLRVQRIQAILSALSKIEIDKATESDVLTAMPYLTRCATDSAVRPNKEVGDVEAGTERCYHAAVRTDGNRWMRFEMFTDRLGPTRYKQNGKWSNWALSLAGVLGYRYINFGASVILLNGRVSSIRYGIADHLVFPEVLGDVVSVKSVHSFWRPYRSGTTVSSVLDESPNYGITGDDEWGINVWFTPDAPAALKTHAFSLDLSCFWGLRACYADQVAASAWRDSARFATAAQDRLQSTNPCPDRIIVGRMRYFPDISVLLLEYIGSEKRQPPKTNTSVKATSSPYKLIAILRGRAFDASADANPQGLASGQQVLAFSGPRFVSCRTVLATPSAVAVVRDAASPIRRAEDEPVSGLQ